MTNMSYCRWRNTAGDFEDCVRAIGEHEDGPEPGKTWEDSLTHEEAKAMRSLIEQTADLLENLDNETDNISEETKRVLEETVERIAHNYGYYKDGE